MNRRIGLWEGAAIAGTLALSACGGRADGPADATPDVTDVFVNMASPKAAAQAIARADELGWEPKQYLASISTSISTVLEPAGVQAAIGISSAEWLKAPGDSQWTDDAGTNQYREIIEKYGDRLDPDDRLAAYGGAAAQTLERAEEPTRDALVKSARSLDLELPTLLPGVNVSTSEEHLLPIRQMQLQQFDGTTWNLVEDVIDGGAK